MNTTLPAPPDWALCETAAGRELRCLRRAGQGRLAAWLMIGLLVAVCGYGTAVFVLGWWAGEEVLGGGVVLALLQVAGLLAGLYLISAMFRTTAYRLGKRSLRITAAQPILGESTDEIERADIREVIRLHAMPRPGHAGDSWRTLLAVHRPDSQALATIPLDADEPDESAWLAAQIADWAGVRVRIEADSSE